MSLIPTTLARLALLLSVGLWAFGCQAGPGQADSGKPQSPLTMQLEAEGTGTAGEPLAMTARAAARTALAPVTVIVQLPRNVVLLEGETEWSGTLRPGQPVELRFTVKVPEEGAGTIMATARYEGEAGTRFAAGATLRVGSDASLGGVVPSESEGGRHTERLGEGVVEYPAK